MADEKREGLNRREFLRKAAITGAVAWAVPVIQSVAATPAFAQTQGTLCPHSTPDVAGGSCMGSCHSRGQLACGHDCGGGCAGICNVACSGGQCPPQYCTPSCFNVTNCDGACTVVFTC